MSMAVVKDAFDAEHRGTVLGIMQVLFVIGPVVAPLLGAVIISSLGWRASFWALTVVGVAALVGLAVRSRRPFPTREGCAAVRVWSWAAWRQ